MQIQKLAETTQQLREAAFSALMRHRAISSNFGVGAAFAFDEHIFSGTNAENIPDSAGLTCAERAAIISANNQIGPLGGEGQSGLTWQEAALTAKTERPITPCGICRTVMARVAEPGAKISSYGSSGQMLNLSMEGLLPLAGLGPNGDVKAEINRWRQRGGEIVSQISADGERLMRAAAEVSGDSYLPPFLGDREPKSGAALELSNGKVVTAGGVWEATTRIGSSAIRLAVLKTLEIIGDSPLRAVRVALYTDSDSILRAPSGIDLQALQEIATPDTEILIACQAGEPYRTLIAELLPDPFGRRDLGY